MAGNIKGITIEFRGETTKLQSALNQVNKETRSIDQELRKVNNALKFNPTNVELWRQKQTLLSSKIQETKQKLDVLKQAQAQMDAEGVDKNSKEYRELQREIITTESQLKNFQAQLKKVGNVKLKAVSEKFKKLGTDLTNAGQAMAPFSKAAAVAAAAIGALAVKSGKAADDLNTLSKKYHIATSDLQKYSAAANLVDVDVDTIAKSHTKLVRVMDNASKGNKRASAAFKALGIDIKDANGNLRDGDAVWQDAIKALGGIEDETKRDALAMDLFGKSAAELNPLIEDGGESYEKLSNTLKKYNLDFIDQETLNKANEFNDTLDTMKAVGGVALQTVGSQLASFLLPAMEKFATLVGNIASWLSKLDPTILTIIGTLAVLIAAVAPVLLFLGKIAFAISAITGLMGTLGISMAAIAGPIGIVIAVIAALVVAGVLLYKNWDKIKAKAKQLWTNIKKTFTQIKTTIINTWNQVKAKAIAIVVGIVTKVITTFNNLKARIKAIWTAIRTTITNVWTGIKTKVSNAVTAVRTKVTSVFSSLKDKVKSTWNKIKEAITKPIKSAQSTLSGIVSKIKGMFPISIGNIMKNIKLPHFKWHMKTVAGKIKIPQFDGISWYARGGIFNEPTIAGLGENGPEAVLPLDKFWAKLDKIAENATGTPINIYVYPSAGMDEKAIAMEVKRQLIQETNRRRLAWQ